MYKYILALLVGFHAYSQKSDSTVKNTALETVVVSATKFSQQKSETPHQIEVISAKQIAFQNMPNTANLLEQSGNIFLQRSQSGGGSPVLRGFEASRVLIVVDGVRMNNAIYRAGHLQNVLRVDQNILEKAEVLFGPGSVMYGSDALGGVMNFRSKGPTLNQINANAYARYGSAYGEKTAHIDVNLGGKRFGSLSSFTISKFGDLVQGNNRSAAYPNFGKRPTYIIRQGDKDVIVPNPDPNTQVFSGYQQMDFLQKLSFEQSSKVKYTVNFQYSNTSDVPRYDRLTDIRNGNLRFAEWLYGPEKRMMVAYQLDLKDTKIYDQGFISAAYQDIDESRISRVYNNLSRKSQLEKVKVYSLNADFKKTIAANTIQYGLEIISNDVNSSANFKNISTGIITTADTRYPNGKNTVNSWAVYATDQLKVSEKLIVNAGLRYNNSRLTANFIDKTFFPFPFSSINQNNAALTGNIGLVFNPSTKTKISVLGSSGFRTPNIDDLTKVFESAAGNLIVPNPNIKPEYTYNGELSLSQQLGGRIRLEGTYFYTSFRNVLIVDAFTLDGKSTIQYAGKESKIQASQNKGRGTINGWNVNLLAKITENLTLTSTINNTKGILNDGKNTPLDHVPPLFGRTGLRFQQKTLQVEVYSLYNGWKKLKDFSPSGEDNLQYATPEGMPAWATLNIKAAYGFNKHLQLQAGIENILDQNYRNFASGISSVGRNFMLTLRVGI